MEDVWVDAVMLLDAMQNDSSLDLPCVGGSPPSRMLDAGHEQSVR